MLISHSIIPSVVLLILGLIIWPILIFCGIVYFIHILVDTFDWGDNFFYFPKKIIGLKVLISKEEFENLSHYLEKYKNPSYFFDFKYYNNKVCITIECLLFIFMVFFAFIFAFEYIFIVLFYFVGLYFHLSRHFHLKKAEES